MWGRVNTVKLDKRLTGIVPVKVAVWFSDNDDKWVYMKTFIGNIFSGHHTTLLIAQNITHESNIEIVVDQIKSGKITSLELDAIYDDYDVFIDLQQQKKALQRDLTQLIIGDADYQATASKLDQLLTEEKQVKINILELALLLEKMDDTEKVKAVRETFLARQLKQIDAILPDEYLFTQFQQHHELKIQQVSQQLIDNANEFLIKAEFTMLNFDRANRYEKAIFYLESGLRSAEESLDGMYLASYHFNFGKFLKVHNQYGDAQFHYERCLSIRQKLAITSSEVSVSALAQTWNNLGNLFKETGQSKKADAAYRQASVLWKPLAETDCQTYGPSLAVTLTNWGYSNYLQHEYSQAETAYQQASTLYQTLASLDPKTYTSYRAMTLLNWGLLYADQNKSQQADLAYQQALSLYRSLAEVDPQHYLADVAQTLINLAVLRAEMMDFVEARRYFAESLQLYKKLAEQNPMAYLPELASALSNWGLFLERQKEYTDARSAYEKALSIRRSLSKQQPSSFLPGLAIILNNLANLEAKEKRFDQAVSACLESLSIRRHLTRYNPKRYRPYLATTLNNLAIIHIDSQKYAEAEVAYKEAIVILRQLAKDYPSTYLPKLVGTAVNQSMFYQKNKPNKAKSMSSLKEAMRAAIRLAEQPPQVKQSIETARQIAQSWGEELPD